MSNIVAQWYEDKKNVDEMQSWNSALKEWERFVVQYLPSGAKYWILVVAWAEKHLHYRIWDMM